MNRLRLASAMIAAVAATLHTADQPFLLPPGVTAGSETAAGAIPLPANDPVYQQARRDESAARPAAKVISAGLSQTVPGRGQVGHWVAGFPYATVDQTCDDKGVVTAGGALWSHPEMPEFWRSTFVDTAPVVIFPDGQKLPQYDYKQVYLGGAYASGEQAGQTLMVFALTRQAFDLNKDVAKVRLVYRHYTGKDGWMRLSMRLIGGATYDRISVRYNPHVTEREEQIWYNGATVEGWQRPDYHVAERKPIDPATSGAIWYALGKKDIRLAGFGVFSPKYGQAYGVGNYGGGDTAIITATAGAEFRWMARPSDAFGEPEKEITAFSKQLPALRKSLESDSLLLPPNATGLALDAGTRETIARLLADAAKLTDAGPAAAVLKAAVADYDKLAAALRSSGSEDAKLDLEVELVQARARIERVLIPLCERWVAAGGVPGKVAAPAKATAPTPIPFDERYDVEAPAYGPELTKWYGEKPAQGRLSVLVLHGNDDNWENYGRKIAELKRALGLDLEYAVVVHSHLMGSRGDADRLRQLLQARRWDVVLDWAVKQGGGGDPNNLVVLPADVRAQLYRAVLDQGTGLVVLGCGYERAKRAAGEFCRDDRLQTSDSAKVLAGLAVGGRRPRLMRGQTHDDVVAKAYELFTAGAGLALQVQTSDGGFGAPATNSGTMCDMYAASSEFEPWSLANRVDADYFHAELGRLLWRAAGREPAVTVLSGPGTMHAEAGRAPAPAAWRIRADASLKDLVASVRLRGLDGVVVAERKLPLKLVQGEAEIPLAPPPLGAGHWYADLFIDSARGRENYGYAAISVPGLALGVAFDPVRLGDAAPVAMGLPPGTDCSGSVSLPEKTALPEHASLRVRLRDEFGRVLAEQKTPVDAGKPTAFRFPTGDLERIPLRVEAQLLGGDGTVLGNGAGEINLLLQRRDRFHVSVAGGPGDPWWRWTLRNLWRLGVTIACREEGAQGNLGASLFSGFGSLSHPSGNGESLGHMTLYNLSLDEANGLRILPPAGWNSPEGQAGMLDRLEHAWVRTRATPSPMTVIYDEGSIYCADTSPVGMKAWQDWLKADYRGDITALNREWNSSYATFEAIDSTTGRRDKAQRGDFLEFGALTAGNAARWADRMRFANQNYCKLILEGCTQRASRFDPGARIGLSGTFLATHNFVMDYDAWLKSSGFWTPYAAPRGYDGLVMDLIRSNRPPGYLYSYWMGYTNGSELPMAWDMVFKGANGIWWFMVPGDGPSNRGTLGLIGRNDRPYAVRQRLIDQAILPLRRGLGDLLLRLDQRNDPVAIYHSPQIGYANTINGIPDNKGPGLGRDFADASAAAGASDLIRDCGREFLYLTKGRILAGDLTKLGIRMLLLPLAQPLGEDEIAVFRAFVEGGGVLVADQRPGVLSGHIRPIAQGPADGLFGIKRSGPGKPEGGQLAAASVLGVEVPLGAVQGDSQLELAGGTAAATVGGLRLLIEHKVGRGSAWLLNTSFAGYGQTRAASSGEPWRRLFGALARQAGVPAPAAVAARGDGSNPLTRLVQWQRGGVRIFGLLDGSGSGTLTLPESAVLFDLRKGPLGKVDTAPIAPFAADTAHFIAAYAYDPGRPQVAVGKPEGTVVACTISMSGVPASETGTFSYHTRLSDPKGTWVDVIPWSVQGAGGKAGLRIRFALDDPPGEWTLAVREITTGREMTVKIPRP